jgi:hypothetical protein
VVQPRTTNRVGIAAIEMWNQDKAKVIIISIKMFISVTELGERVAKLR